LGETDGQRTLVLSGLKIGDEVIVRGWQSIVREDALCAILLPTVVAPLRAKR
jgi:hypothetical protein